MNKELDAKTAQHRLLYAASWGLLLCAMVIGFQAIYGQAYGSVDGEWAGWYPRAIWQWSSLFDSGPVSFLSGMGSPYLPNLPWLNPGAAVLSLSLKRETTYLLSYLIYALETGLSVVFLMRAIGLPSLLSHLVGQLHVLLFFPPFYGALLASIPNYLLAPVNAHLMTLFNFATGLFLLVGRLSLITNALACLAVTAIGLALLISAPFTALTFLPVYITATVAVVLARPLYHSELRWKVLAITAVALTLWTIGAIEYLLATSSVTARASISGKEFLQPFDFESLATSILNTCRIPTSSLLCISDLALPLTTLAIAGAALTFATAKRELRNLAIWFIAFTLFVNLYAGPSSYFFNELPSIRAEFLIWSMYTFYPLFIVMLPVSIAAAAIDTVSLNLSTRDRSPFVTSKLLLVGIFLVPFGALTLVPWRSLQIGWPPSARTEFRFMELAQGPIIQALSSNISLQVGGPFRGYAATFFTDPSGKIRAESGYHYPPASWLFNSQTRFYFYKHYNNTFQETGLWRFSIPSFEEYGQSVTYQAFVFMSALLAPSSQLISGQFFLPKLEEDTSVLSPQFLRVYRLDIELLKSLGVRYLITDNAIDSPNARLIVTEHNEGAVPVHLFELSRPNIGTYSPLRLIHANNFDEAVNAIRRNSDREGTAVTYEQVAGPFSAAKDIKIVVERSKLRVTARSLGKAAVLLPFQFSHCLAATSITGHQAPRLLRANLIQTLLLFDREVSAEITFDFGLFRGKRCRLQDAADIKAMHLLPQSPQSRT